jgi:choline dehydrogenase-like flavoprotein
LIDLVKKGLEIPTIAIIGGGTGGNLLAARLLERSRDGQRLNVMLIEARGRAGPHLRGIVRHAERTSPGAFLTRLRGEAIDVHAVPREPRVRIRLRSGRCLDADRAVLVIGSVAAASVGTGITTRPPAGVYLLASDGAPDVLAGPVDELVGSLLAQLQAARAPAA